MHSRLTLVATIVVALVASGCTAAGSGSPAASGAATAASAPTVRAAVSPSPTPLNAPIDDLATHISASVDELIGLTVDSDLSQWFSDESDWVSSHESLTAGADFLDYRSALIAGLLATVNESDYSDAVAEVVAAAKSLPNVVLTAVAPTPEPVPDVAKVGDRLVFTSTDDDGNSLYLKVVRVANWKSTNQFTKPDSGNKFVVADVLFEGKSGEIDARAGEFTIEDADGYVYEISPMWKETSLPYDISLKKGRKVRGWLTFEVPRTLKAGWIVYAESQIEFTAK